MKKLFRQQLNEKMLEFVSLQKQTTPSTGWIKSIRNALGMSMQQMGEKLHISKQSIHDIEKREKDGSITIRSLREAGKALEMELVYGFVPADGSIDALIQRKAEELATQIVMRTSATMKLADSQNSEQRIEKAIEEMSELLINEKPKILWD